MLLQPPYTRVDLQRVIEELVHLGDAARDAEVDGPVADLDDKATDDVGVDLGGCQLSSTPRMRWILGKTYLVGDLELLALADVLRLGDGGLQPGKSLVVQLLKPHQ